MTDRDQIIEAMARALMTEEGQRLDAPLQAWAHTYAAAALAAAEAAGMRMVGPGEAVVPRVLTEEMAALAVMEGLRAARQGDPVATVKVVWNAAVAAAEKDQ